MSYAENMRILSNINCALSSGLSYIDQRENGVPRPYAMNNLFGNLANGFARNEIAYDMQRYGNPVGNYINAAAGYGNPVANTIGTLGIMGACTPWMFFRMPSFMFGCPNIGFYSGLGMGFGSVTITTTTGFRHNAFRC